MNPTSKSMVISLILFLFIFCFLGLPFTHWWFNGDDFSAIALGKCMQTWDSFWQHFFEGDVIKYFYPSHHIQYTPYGMPHTQKLTFFGVYYRPIHCAYCALAYWLFGTYAYPYYLTSVFLHALNTSILFNILRWFSGWATALFFSLLFALHPQIGFRFGAPANFQYYFNVLMLLLTVITFKYFLDRRAYLFLFLSTLFYAFALFTRETAIILPGLLFIGGWLYQKKIIWAPIAHCIPAAGYLALRMWYYPFNTEIQGGAGGNGLPINLTFLLKVFSKAFTRIDELLVCIYDSLSLSWLPYGHKALRFGLVAILLAIIVFLFIRNKNKLTLIFLATSYCFMLWPSLIGAYSPRYFYESSPLLMAFFTALKGGIRGERPIINNIIIKKLLIPLFLTIIPLYAFFTFTNLRCRETKLHTIKEAFLSLANNQQIASGTRPLWFLAFPLDGFGTGIEQAAWLFLTPSKNPVYYDPSTMLTQLDSNVLENAGWYMRSTPYYTTNHFTIIKTPNTIRLTSKQPEKISFALRGTDLALGPKTIHKTAIIKNQSVATDVTITIAPAYLEKKPIFITWDYEQRTFIVHE